MNQFIQIKNQAFSALSSLFQTNENEIELYRGFFIRENIKRAFYLALVIIFISSIHAVVFYAGLPEESGIHRNWHLGIIYCHLFLVFSMSILGYLSHYFLHVNLNLNAGFIVSTLIKIIILFMGIVITSVDQLVTASITPFLLSSVMISMVFVMRPVKTVIIYILSLIIFNIVIGFSPQTEEMILSNRVNALYFSLGSMFLSMVMWRFNISRLLQSEVIRLKNEELINQHKEKDTVFRIIAHDLKGPISSMMVLSEMLKEEDESEHPDVAERSKMIQAMYRGNKGIQNLLDTLLAWAQLKQNLIPFQPEVLKPAMILQPTLDLLKVNADTKHQQIKCDIAQDTTIIADAQMLQTLVRNLISNAIKFSHPNSEILFTAMPAEREITFAIKDQGIGMDKDLLSNLFKLGKKTGRKGTNNEPSSGLGLILCEELVKKMGGQIWAESEDGKGSTFYFSLKKP